MQMVSSWCCGWQLYSFKSAMRRPIWFKQTTSCLSNCSKVHSGQSAIWEHLGKITYGNMNVALALVSGTGFYPTQSQKLIRRWAQRQSVRASEGLAPRVPNTPSGPSSWLKSRRLVYLIAKCLKKYHVATATVTMMSNTFLNTASKHKVEKWEKKKLFISYSFMFNVKIDSSWQQV